MRDGSARKKRSNTLSVVPGGKPGPSSVTLSEMPGCRPGIWSAAALSQTWPPLGSTDSAFTTRFCRMRSDARRSPVKTSSGSPGAAAMTSSATPWAAA